MKKGGKEIRERQPRSETIEQSETPSCKQSEAPHSWRRLLPWRQRLHPFVKDVTQGESGLMRKDSPLPVCVCVYARECLANVYLSNTMCWYSSFLLREIVKATLSGEYS